MACAWTSNAKAIMNKIKTWSTPIKPMYQCNDSVHAETHWATNRHNTTSLKATCGNDISISIENKLSTSESRLWKNIRKMVIWHCSIAFKTHEVHRRTWKAKIWCATTQVVGTAAPIPNACELTLWNQAQLLEQKYANQIKISTNPESQNMMRLEDAHSTETRRQYKMKSFLKS